MRTVEEANQLLKCGNYGTLEEAETQSIFGLREETIPFKQSQAEQGSNSDGLVLLAAIFAVSKDELDTIVATVKDGPPPVWPRVLAAILRRASDRFVFSLRTILWIWLWVIAWWLIGPSLRLPYVNRDVAFRAIWMYVGGSIVVPLLIGLLITTRDNEYWQRKKEIKPFLLRLYTYQGAGIGFNLGYFFMFSIVLLRYYLHDNPSISLEWIAALISLILGQMGARVVPHNLWRAYGRLSFKDGWIFFVVALVGLFWGFFFFQYYAVLLTPLWGALIILTAFTVAVIMMSRPSRTKMLK